MKSEKKRLLLLVIALGAIGVLLSGAFFKPLAAGQGIPTSGKKTEPKPPPKPKAKPRPPAPKPKRNSPAATEKSVPETKREPVEIKPVAPPATQPSGRDTSPVNEPPIKKQENVEVQTYTERINGVPLEMVRLPAGRFLMGSPTNEADRSADEGPQHEVTISQSFYMGKYEVTQAQWKAVAGLPKVKIDLNADPSRFKGDNLPVEQVSWEEAKEFCARLTRATGKSYRLPSEAEWEYACRAGTTTPFAFGATITPDIVNYDGNYAYGNAAKGINRGTTIAVGSLGKANNFGLYDMHGNVWEWCEDVFHDDYTGAPVDGNVWLTSRSDGKDYRLLRGGSWLYNGRHCRSAVRLGVTAGYRSDLIGFRVVAVVRT